ncbi:hypothetical protein BJY01DRAFT_247129 [Aspergillus pseudoustus]|uniref:Carboxylesterase type B domain-containing protein n=1 Tax=Aspergillus pseudoustus TaxID=1810923 RepID=A0ABR4K2Z0_9EURO
MFGSNAQDAWSLRAAVLSAYPIGPISGIRSPGEQIAVIITEYIFQCPSKLIVDATSDVGIPAWRYYFNASFPNTEIFPGSGAYHSSEIGLVFGTH